MWDILHVRVHIWLSLVGPKLEVGTKIREAISYKSSLDHMELVCHRCYLVPGLSAKIAVGLLQV